MDLLSQFEMVARSHPHLAIFLAFAGGVPGRFHPLHVSHDAHHRGVHREQGRGKRWRGLILAVFYVLGLAIVYSVLGAFAAFTGQLFGSLTANRWTYFFVGNVCLFFGMAMLEAVPLSPPAFLNRLQVRDLPGHDIMTSILLGGASALIVSTCTTPILGVLLTIVATRQEVIWGIGMLFAFAYGMGSLVILVGAFTGLLTSLPRSRVWMLRVQRFFGFLMVLAAEYFFIKTGEYWL